LEGVFAFVALRYFSRHLPGEETWQARKVQTINSRDSRRSAKEALGN
jgi:hypothetical protein